MGAKKKKDKKADAEVVEAPKKKIPTIKENWVNIQFKLLNWSFMNFSMMFRENTRIFTLKKLLQERHGRIDDLKLCFHAFNETNEIKDEMMTLKECGLKGVPLEPPELEEGADPATQIKAEDIVVPSIILMYDFKPANFSDPVVLYFH
mmetsp:Transcript_14024/g.23327  ORF Transcript_14024/g.23327 Transcript_14024/m.23327 type:complete len:148 (+) Transcript_14024:98-541(+)|eukprot:CAMPEP_0174976174 /NCGR_PEP_ID=MMETSP0004_2-20121128/12879_1 /TAXON_ID=420556 /ORGANISM="Ochromonas sp., Strain CCMP1393" /LENGTH=147 /DNA_ID=CAMNT_0016227161 /DNA_START=93 /DNA_END=539 /DNA_ORIENTATION=+